MDWAADTLYAKARLYVGRAQDEPIASPLFGFWTSLALELLCRAALARIHPVLLADPTSEGNIQYAFGFNPKSNPRSVHAKTVFARCSVFVDGFTDQMSAHCLIMADRRNAELHSGAAAFEVVDNSLWLPLTYEVAEVLLKHLGRDFDDFLGGHAPTAEAMLADRQSTRKKEVNDRIAAARKLFGDQTSEEQEALVDSARTRLELWARTKALRRICTCPACGSPAAMAGESLTRGPVRVDEDAGAILQEVRVLPNRMLCTVCRLDLKGFQELHEAGLGAIYTAEEEQDPIEFFGIVPEEHVDVDELIRERQEEEWGYQNE
ncbi:hypothetical protein [Phenylobacterium sp.]|uniref:hypothetical protein n=1 Tax=Phenylobacterium sp. TaxID=1871053 RepID=UPI00273076CF|nr:hypothetical protein [Phenylobacterium sp.]MDP1873534.1 hypothetical protein [Phenylobacterium sp.]